VPIELTGSGESFEIAGVMVEVLSPAFDASPDAASDNNHSLVLRLTYGDRSFLLTGDVEQLAETQLLSSGSVAPADVVKVPHHGSRTSSTPPFVDAVHARYAVVSAPKRSPFGHPHAEIVHRWQNARAETVMTGRCGTITISTDSDDLRVSSYLPGCFGK
jgi:competence protein ComEC